MDEQHNDTIVDREINAFVSPFTYNFTAEDFVASGHPFCHPIVTVREIGEHYSTNIPFRVRGYWARDVIVVNVRRELVWHEWRAATEQGTDERTAHERLTQASKFVVSISHSSGGRSDECSDPQAALYLASALIHAANLALSIEAEAPELQRIACEQALRERREAEAKLAAKQAAIDADAPVSESRATFLVDAAVSMARWKGQAFIFASERGEPTTVRRLSFKPTKSGDRFTIRIDDRAVSRADCIKHLCTLSDANVLGPAAEDAQA